MLGLLEIAKHLDMSDRNARDVLKKIAVISGYSQSDWWVHSTLDEIRTAYIRDLRNKAAGRGGTEQEELTKAKTRQAKIDAANKELQFHQAVKNLVPVQEIEPILSGWAVTARSEFLHALERIVSGIESKHGITVDTGFVNKHATVAFEAVAAYPKFAVKTAMED